MSIKEEGPPAGRQEGQNKKENCIISNLPENDDFVNIPEEMKKIPTWVCWRYEDRNGKISKRPIDPINSRPAATNDPTSWSTFKKALQYFQQTDAIDGIGFVFSESDPYVGVDIDDCRDPETGVLKPHAKDFVDTLQTYTEVSPSGRGIHIIIQAAIPKRIIHNDPKIEIYGSRHYFTFTGENINGFKAIESRQGELQQLINKYCEKSSKKTSSKTEITHRNPIPIEKDDEIIQKAMDAKNGDKFRRLWAGDLSDHMDDHSGGDMALCNMIAHYTQDPEQIDRIFRISGFMRPKWDEKHSSDGSTYGQMTIKKAIKFNNETCSKSELSEHIEENEPPSTRPILDNKALHGIAGRFVELATRNSEADPAAVLATFLVRFCVEVGPDIVFLVGDTKHYARLFAVIVGETSKARKGTSASPVERLFAFSAIRTSPGPLSTGEGLIAAVQNNTEGKNDSAKQNKRLFVLDQEFAAALSCTKREGNTLSTIIRSAWDNGNLDPLTKHSKISTTNAHIGIISHITLFELNNKMQNIEAFNGFANRILWVYSMREKKIPLPQPMPDDELTELVDKLKSILKKISHFENMKFSSDAEVYWTKIYDDLSEGRPGLLGSITSRSEAQVLRLSMVYSLLDGSDTIQVVHIEAALAFWQYCEQSAALIFGNREKDSTLQRIVDLLKTGTKAKTDFHHHFNKHIRKEELETALKELERQGRISIEKIGTGGAPKTVYKLIQP